MMQSIEDIRGVDARAGRLLLGLEAGQVAELAGIDARTVQRFEGGDATHLGTRTAILTALALQGARFVGKGDVRHVDGRIAPTPEAVGKLKGDRLGKARRALRLSRQEVAYRARLTGGTYHRMEIYPHDLASRPTAGFYRVVGVLQLAGYLFEPWRHGGISGDRLLIEPERPVDAPKDRARYHTKGLVIPGFPRALEGEEVPD